MISEADKILTDKYANDNLSEDELKLFGEKIKDTEFAEYARFYTEATVSMQTFFDMSELPDDNDKFIPDKYKNNRHEQIKKILLYIAASVMLVLTIVFATGNLLKEDKIAKLKLRLLKQDSVLSVLKTENTKLYAEIQQVKKNLQDTSINNVNNQSGKQIAGYVKNKEVDFLEQKRSENDDSVFIFFQKGNFKDAVRCNLKPLKTEKYPSKCKIYFRQGIISLNAVQSGVDKNKMLDTAIESFKYTSQSADKCSNDIHKASLLYLSYCYVLSENKGSAKIHLKKLLNLYGNSTDKYTKEAKILIRKLN